MRPLEFSSKRRQSQGISAHHNIWLKPLLAPQRIAFRLPSRSPRLPPRPTTCVGPSAIVPSSLEPQGLRICRGRTHATGRDGEPRQATTSLPGPQRGRTRRPLRLLESGLGACPGVRWSSRRRFDPISGCSNDEVCAGDPWASVTALATVESLDFSRQTAIGAISCLGSIGWWAARKSKHRGGGALTESARSFMRPA